MVYFDFRVVLTLANSADPESSLFAKVLVYGVSSIQKANAFGVVLCLIKLVQIHVSKHIPYLMWNSDSQALIGEL